MKQDRIDEWLIAYIEGELSFDERLFVREKLAYDSHWQISHQQINKTRQRAGEDIVYPWKRQLYKREPRIFNKKMTTVTALAAILIMVIGWVYNPFEYVLIQGTSNTGWKAVQEKKQSKNGKEEENGKSIHLGLAHTLESTNAKPNSIGKKPIANAASSLKNQNEKRKKSKNKNNSGSTEDSNPNPNQMCKIDDEAKMCLIGQQEMASVPDEHKAKTLPENFHVSSLEFHQISKTNTHNQSKKDNNSNEQAQASLLASVVQKVFNVKIEDKNGAKEKDGQKSSVRIETNPLAIRANIHIN